MLTARIAMLGCAALLATACAATSRQYVPMPELDSTLAAGTSRVVLLREGRVVGSAREVLVYEGEQEVGRLLPGGYLCWDRPARAGFGRVVFSGYRLDQGEVENVFDLPREAGTTGWFVIRLRQGDRKPLVESLPAEQGRSLITQREPAVVD